MLVGDMVRISVKAEQYTQAVNNSFDYELESAPGEIPLTEVLSDWKTGVWDPRVRNWQFHHLNTYLFRAQVYENVHVLSTDDGPSLRIRYKDTAEISGDHPGLRSAGTPLPTYVAVSGRKTTGGNPFALLWSGDRQSWVNDSRFRGGFRFAGLTEAMTQDAQGNKLSVVTGANWLGTWQASADALLAPQFQFGAFGGTYRLRMHVMSLRASGNVIRGGNDTPRIAFRRVVSMPISQFVGSQITRKQRQIFQ